MFPVLHFDVFHQSGGNSYPKPLRCRPMSILMLLGNMNLAPQALLPPFYAGRRSRPSACTHCPRPQRRLAVMNAAQCPPWPLSRTKISRMRPELRLVAMSRSMAGASHLRDCSLVERYFFVITHVSAHTILQLLVTENECSRFVNSAYT